jgi:GNAT superfamily N-acetyltransferase
MANRMLVGKDHRGKGVEATLIDAILEQAKRLGFAAIYTSTRPRDGLARSDVWQEIGASRSLKGPVTVYRRQTGDRRGN